MIIAVVKIRWGGGGWPDDEEEVEHDDDDEDDDLEDMGVGSLCDGQGGVMELLMGRWLPIVHVWKYFNGYDMFKGRCSLYVVQCASE